MRVRDVVVAAVAGFAVLATGGCSSDEPGEKLVLDEQSEAGDDDRTDEVQPEADPEDGEGEEEDDGDDSDDSDDSDVVIEGDDADAKGETVDDATATEVEAFMADYLDAQNQATEDGDFATADAMVESCQVCSASKAYITRVYDNGGELDGGLYENPEIAVAHRYDDRIRLTVTSVITAYTATDGSGNELDSGPAEEQQYEYYVSQVDGDWKIVAGRFVQ